MVGAVRGTRDLEGYLDVASGARRLPLPALLAADVREREGRISLPVTDLARRGFGALCEHPGGTEERRSRGNLHSAPVLPQHTLRIIRKAPVRGDTAQSQFGRVVSAAIAAVEQQVYADCKPRPLVGSSLEASLYPQYRVENSR